MAQVAAEVPAQNVVQLSASGSVDVQPDLLSISLTATRQGNDAAMVQTALKSSLDTALAEAKKTAAPGQMEVRTGNFNLSPRYETNGKISAWQGTAELVLEGRDFARISAAAGRIQALNVTNVSFGMSRELRARAEADAQSLAIEDYKRKADQITKAFGFSHWTLREVTVSGNEQPYMPQPRMMQARVMAMSSAPQPVEAGTTTVRMMVSGGVQMR